ncbi:MAG: heme-copper oxidase subunit III [Phycisphaerae bacterium]|nr:heme-copper oxidase subunit III [Phycisphaerae bacterium]
MTDDIDLPPHALNAAAGSSRQPMLFVPGAGAMGVGLLVFSLSVLFASSLIGYLYIRAQAPVVAHLRLPNLLWVSTAVLLISSITMHAGLRAIQHGRESRLTRNLAATFGLGLLFLILQAISAVDIFHSLQLSNIAMARVGIRNTGGLAPGLTPVVQTHVLIAAFYVFTALHALHVIGGLIPLGVVLQRAINGVYSRNYYPGVRYCSIYWHFLDVVWLVIFVVLLATF